MHLGLICSNTAVIKTLEGAKNITKIEFGMQSYTLYATSISLDLSECTALTSFSASYWNVKEVILPYSISYINYSVASGNLIVKTTDNNGIQTSNLTNAYLRSNSKIQTILTNLGNSCKKLTSLEVFNNQGNITDFSVLNGCSSLSHLKVTGAQWTGKLNYTNISTLNSLVELNSLKTITFAWLTISNLNCIKDLTSLTTLYIYNTDLVDINSISNLINLVNVEIHDNKISDISALKTCTKITSLKLYNNFINSGIKEISTLTLLDTLDLRNNSLTDRATNSSDGNTYNVLNSIVDLNKNSALKTLKISNNNGIIDWSPLKNGSFTSIDVDI